MQVVKQRRTAPRAKAPDAGFTPQPPLRPRPRLVKGLGVVLGLWILGLLAMYLAG